MLRITANHVVILALFTPIVCMASTITLQPGPGEGLDTYINSNLPSQNYGTSDTIYLYGQTGISYNGLVNWNLDSLPEPIEVTAATMYLYCEYTDPNTFGSKIELYTITENWQETSVTWNNRPDATLLWELGSWPHSDTWYSFDVTDIIEDITTGGSYGVYLAIKRYSESASCYMEFCSSDCSTADLRPKLDVEYVETGIKTSSLGSIKASFR